MGNDQIKVLLVEDDEGIREVMSLVLELEGYKVTGLANGHDVLDKAQLQLPDVILLDVMLGDVDGRDICRALKADPQTQNIPVMIVSATYGYSDPVLASCGANDYMGKPFDIRDLVARVKYLAA